MMESQKRFALSDFVWTTAAVADEAGVSVRYIGQLCREGRLVAFQIGGRWLVSDESVREWMQNRRGPGRPRTKLRQLPLSGVDDV